LLRKYTRANKTSYTPDTVNLTPVTLELQTYDVHTAVFVASDHIDLLRAALNLPPAMDTLRQYNTTSEPLSNCLPSPVYAVFDQDGGYREPLHYSTEPYRYRAWKPRKQDTERSLAWIGHFNKAEKGNIADLITQLAQLYQNALDFSDFRGTYLALWQVLEALTLTEAGERGTNLLARLTTLLEIWGDSAMKKALDIVLDSRNALVHSGVFLDRDNAEELVFTLKGFVDRALCKLLCLSKDLSTESELRAYFRLKSKSDAELDTEKRVLNFIGSMRNK